MVKAEPSTNTCKDFFVERDGLRFAGTHLLIEFWGARFLDDRERLERGLRAASEAAGATLLQLALHTFEPNGGISGVAILAESHISIHTWPERSYAAVDVFMCGRADPYRALGPLRALFEAESMQLSEHRRGILPAES